MRARLPIRASRLSSALAPPPTPITAMRPPVASACRLPARLGAPTSSSTTSKGPCSSKPSGAIDRGPEALDPGAQLLAAHGGHHPGARRAAQLDRGGAHAAGAAVHEQPLARAAAPAWLKSASWAVVNTSGQPARLGPVEPVGHRHRGALVHHRQLGLAAAAHDRHHPVALGEALRARAQGRHLAGQLEARDVRRATRAAPGSRP